MPDVVVGCTYALTRRNASRKRTVSVVTITGEANPVDGMHPVLCNERPSRLQLSLYDVKRVRVSRASKAGQVWLYLCDIGGGHYKLGASSAPSRREKQIRTYARTANMIATAKIPPHRSRGFRHYERAVLDRFASQRVSSGGGSEVMKLSLDMVAACVRQMREVCAKGA